MAKSLKEIIEKIERDKIEKALLEKQLSEKESELDKKIRKEYLRRNAIYERLGIITSNSSAAGGGSLPSSETITLSIISGKIRKTSQTTSYATGDDGDLEAGRQVDFFTLDSNNPFGNTNRFTDDIGDQTYANGFVLDWSTFDGETVLGVQKVQNSSNTNFANSVTNALAASIGGYSSGWRLPNYHEMENLINHEVATTGLNYAPFNNTFLQFWTSTTNAVSTGSGLYLINNSRSIGSIGKSSSINFKWFAVRDFTMAELSLPTSSPFPNSAKLMKTDQTISYTTGDDGTNQSGRLVDALTLTSNNPFGNTNRLTDTLGTQVYANDIVVDWSTYNLLDVLCYRRTTNSVNINWSTALSECNSLTVDGISGWKMPNILELLNIVIPGSSKQLNYGPFSITTGNIWSSTNTSSNAIVLLSSNGCINSAQTKTNSAGYRYLPCRYFSNAELGL